MTLAHAQFGSVDIDGFSIDVFHHQIGLAIRVMTGIQQPGDIGMRQRSQNLLLCQEALAAELRGVRSRFNEFHGYLLRDLTVLAFG